MSPDSYHQPDDDDVAAGADIQRIHRSSASRKKVLKRKLPPWSRKPAFAKKSRGRAAVDAGADEGVVASVAWSNRMSALRPIVRSSALEAVVRSR